MPWADSKANPHSSRVPSARGSSTWSDSSHWVPPYHRPGGAAYAKGKGKRRRSSQPLQIADAPRQPVPARSLDYLKHIKVGNESWYNRSPYSQCNKEYENVSSLYPYPEQGDGFCTIARLIAFQREQDSGGRPESHWTVSVEENANLQHKKKAERLPAKTPPMAYRDDMPLPGLKLPHHSAYHSKEWMDQQRYMNQAENLIALHNDPSKFVTMVYGRPVILLILVYPESKPDAWLPYLGYHFRPLRPIYISGVQGHGKHAPEISPSMAVCNAFKAHGD